MSILNLDDDAKNSSGESVCVPAENNELAYVDNSNGRWYRVTDGMLKPSTEQITLPDGTLAPHRFAEKLAGVAFDNGSRQAWVNEQRAFPKA